MGYMNSDPQTRPSADIGTTRRLWSSGPDIPSHESRPTPELLPGVLGGLGVWGTAAGIVAWALLVSAAVVGIEILLVAVRIVVMMGAAL